MWKCPREELQDAIYLTPDYEYAVAMAVKPGGVTEIDNEAKTIEFENPEDFDPERNIYIYTIDSDDIPEEHLKKVRDERGEFDGLQYAALISKIIPKLKENKKAREVMRYYKLLNWEEKEINKEKSVDNNLKIR